MRNLFRIVQLADAKTDTQPNADGILPEPMRAAAPRSGSPATSSVPSGAMPVLLGVGAAGAGVAGAGVAGAGSDVAGAGSGVGFGSPVARVAVNVAEAALSAVLASGVVVETVAVAAVEVKLVAELHAVYGVDIPGTGTQRFSLMKRDEFALTSRTSSESAASGRRPTSRCRWSGILFIAISLCR